MAQSGAGWELRDICPTDFCFGSTAPACVRLHLLNFCKGVGCDNTTSATVRKLRGRSPAIFQKLSARPRPRGQQAEERVRITGTAQARKEPSWGAGTSGACTTARPRTDVARAATFPPSPDARRLPPPPPVPPPDLGSRVHSPANRKEEVKGSQLPTGARLHRYSQTDVEVKGGFTSSLPGRKPRLCL